MKKIAECDWPENNGFSGDRHDIGAVGDRRVFQSCRTVC
jgi:hypothetical protein